MEEYRRGKREQSGRPPRHTLRNLIIVLTVLALAAAAVLKWGLPLWLERTAPGAQPPAQSDSPADTSQEEEPEPSSAGPEEPDVPEAPEETPEEPESPVEEPSEEPEPTQSTEEGEENFLILVNRDHYLPEDYTVELTQLSNGESVATSIYPSLQQMFDDARADGVYPIVASGFRTAERQQELMDQKIQSFLDQGYSQEDAETEALKWVNAVGASEHQSGLAVDINADGIHSAGYEVYAWLAQNAWRYGFILRYPEDKTGITGTDYEPWHYRYVGTEAAKEIYESGLCLEEYLDS